MLTGRFHQKPSDRWIGGVPPGPEDSDSAFNIMSPTGRNRPFKGIVLPNKRIGSIPWESTHPVSISNTISSNNSGRDHRNNNSNNNSGWGMFNDEDHYGIHVPEDSSSSDGVAFVYNKGPAGQTPFPTLVAMPGYFPLGQVLAPTPQSPPSSSSSSPDRQKQGQDQNTNLPPMADPYGVSSLDYAQPSLDSVVLNDLAAESASRT
ncbi:hypothetical protein EMPS_05806 [Entomortierella parvispora]|uniref:Uncharacterized protein n=1 Tax=Entomortierella parvispora TaxID=205924 RepID=A0A9P3LWV0_9FUNG|nr:hypothetical protein EMPS_05806 [Entomortierella parvispora]